MVEVTSEIFIDIQGYNCSFGFIPKELAIYDGIRLSNYLFKPPFKRSMLSDVDEKIVTWSEEYHGLEWESGCMNLCEIDDIIKNVYNLFNKPKIFVKGVEKTKFIKGILNAESIVSIPVASDPKISKFRRIPECYFHKTVDAWHCAVANVKLLYSYKSCYQ
jgi:hypothetical protein